MTSPALTLRICFSALAALMVVQPGNASATKAPIRVVQVSLPLASGDIKAELFEQAPTQKRPVVVVLHGAGGTLLDGPEMRRVARHLAAEGNAVYVPRYFKRTGTVFALDAAMQKNFETWRATVMESIAAIQQLRGDAAPLGIYGYSLGGFLALSAGSDNARVGAVVEHAGGVWNGKMDRIGRMPAILMLHGKQDGRVPFEQYAKPLVPVLRKRGKVLETRFFSEEGHTFSPAAMQEVRTAAAQFFRRHLRPR